MSGSGHRSTRTHGREPRGLLTAPGMGRRVRGFGTGSRRRWHRRRGDLRLGLAISTAWRFDRRWGSRAGYEPGVLGSGVGRGLGYGGSTALGRSRAELPSQSMHCLYCLHMVFLL